MSSDSDSSSSSTSVGKVPLPSTSPPPRIDDMSQIPIPDAPHPLDEIPIPFNTGIKNLQDEIPLPPDYPDSSRYSPSQAAAEDELITSPGQCELVSSTATKLSAPGETPDVVVTSSSPKAVQGPASTKSSSSSSSVTKVLDRAQAKKRLMAFSAAKLQAVSTSSSSSRKGNVLKGISVFNPKEKKQQSSSQMNIEAIREDDTKIKEIIAVNKILSDKLKQVNSITNNIPKSETEGPQPLMGLAITNPITENMAAIPPLMPISEPTVSESTPSSSPAVMKPPSLMGASRHLRKRSISHSPSPGPTSRRSRSRDRDSRRRKSSKERDHHHERSSRRDDKRRSRSPPHSSSSRGRKSRSPGRGRRISRSKSPIVLIRRSISPPHPKHSSSSSSKRHEKSPRISSKEKNKDGKSLSRSKSPPTHHKDSRWTTTIRKYSTSKSKSRSVSPPPPVVKLSSSTKRVSLSRSKSRSKSPLPPTPQKKSSRKSRSKSKSPKSSKSKDKSSKSRSKKSKRSRSRDREEKKRRDESKERRKEAERIEMERKAVEKELDKVRLVRMPTDWTEYFKFQYTPHHIKDLHLRLMAANAEKKTSR